MWQNQNWTTQKTRLKRFNETTIFETADERIIYHNIVKRRLHNFDIAEVDYKNGHIIDFRPGMNLFSMSKAIFEIL